MKYEYKQITTQHLLSEWELNDEGCLRWELVSVIAVAGEFHHIFKRAIID